MSYGAVNRNDIKFESDDSTHPPSTWKLIRGITFVSLLICSGLASFLFVFPTVFLIPLRLSSVLYWKRRYLNCLSLCFFNFAAALIKHVAGTKIVVHSNVPMQFPDRRCGNMLYMFVLYYY